MMRHFAYTFLLFIVIKTTLSAQVELAPKRTLNASRITEKIKLDAEMSEAVWASAAVADSFLYGWPNPGRPASERTEVRILYDNAALYVFFKCFAHPDSIQHRVTKRDELENTDHVSIIIDAYRDGQNALEFGVSPDNVQFDSKYSIANANPNEDNADGEDSSWDAVWNSSAKLTDYGWAAEFEIPYSALRFPKKDVQDWGVNFYRRIARKGEFDSWNEIKAAITGSLNQMGIMSGLEGIKAPLRLSATPFFTTYAQQQYNQPGTTNSFPYSVGMDIKYGINEAFTLDAALIPDFGQVRSDQQVLNLSPFEVRFQENRPFFTEGTELFNKGGFFYSRRVGGRPIYYDEAYNQATASEEVTSNPSQALLLNATKLSGRTNSGLGIGVFNAIEAPTRATLTDTETGTTRQVETAPLTNKNIIVIDQNLRNNSSVTFINTNVTRSGSDIDANLTGMVFNLKTAKQNYGLSGKVATSNRYQNGTNTSGYTIGLDGGKTSGNFQYGFGYNLESDQYNSNDLGYLQSPNENGGFGWVNYSRFKPWWKLNNYWSSVWSEYQRLFRPNVWTSSAVGFNFGGNTRSFHNFGVNGAYIYQGENDYFEAGTADFSRFYHVPKIFRIGGWYNSDQRKKLTFNAFANRRWADEAGRRSSYVSLGARWRASNKMTLAFGVGLESAKKNVGNLAYSSGVSSESIGYEDIKEQDIVLGYRDLKSFENTLELSYSFTNRINLALYGRHYWYQVQYQSFGILQADGSLLPSKYMGFDVFGNKVNDEAINFFNIDLVFTWRFAPGSDILVVYKNASSDYQSGVGAARNYVYNAGHIVDFAGQNVLSLKVLYFLDYDRVRKMRG